MAYPLLGANSQQQERIESQSPKGVQISLRHTIDYNVELQKIVNAVKKDIDTVIIPEVKRLAPNYVADSILTYDSWVDDLLAVIARVMNRWNSPQFNSIAEMIAANFVRVSAQEHKKRFDEDMGFGIDVFTDNQSITDYLQLSARNNASLIKSIPEKYLFEVEQAIVANVQAGNRSSSIVKQLSEQYGITQRRARFIARDQASKINGDLNEKRQRDVGFTYFKWLDSDDIRVRDRHSEIANKVTAYGKGVYRWDNLPLSNKGVPIKPGDDYNCRCVAIPVLESKVKANQKAGLTQPGVYR
jgi:SPP1 gp7 family putative phage head morphogenesis protein